MKKRIYRLGSLALATFAVFAMVAVSFSYVALSNNDAVTKVDSLATVIFEPEMMSGNSGARGIRKAMNFRRSLDRQKTFKPIRRIKKIS